MFLMTGGFHCVLLAHHTPRRVVEQQLLHNRRLGHSLSLVLVSILFIRVPRAYSDPSLLCSGIPSLLCSGIHDQIKLEFAVCLVESAQVAPNKAANNSISVFAKLVATTWPEGSAS